MRPIFTIHAGEYLVGDHIERNHKYARVWVPSKDTGVDLLVTDENHKRPIAFQVKYSKDFRLTHVAPELRGELKGCGWWRLNGDKIRSSAADHWIFVLHSFVKGKTDFIVIEPEKLAVRLERLHGVRRDIQSYFWVTKVGRCWETRGLKKAELARIVDGRYSNRLRDFTRHLNNWHMLEKEGAKGAST